MHQTFTNLKFSNFFKYTNKISFLLFFISTIMIFFKGLNYGIDFKGGTLLEIKIIKSEIKISEVNRPRDCPRSLIFVGIKIFKKKKFSLL